MNSRRDFIKQAGLLGLATLAVPSFALNSVHKNMGIQLYTLRDVLPNNVTKVIEAVAKAGYTAVETYGFEKGKFWNFTPKEFKNLLSANGLKAPSGHYHMNDFIKDGETEQIKKDMEACKIIGGEYYTIASATVKEHTVEGYQYTAQCFNKVAEIAKSMGLKFAYHNHNHEFTKIGDTTGYEVYLKESDKNLVDFEMDLYWVVRSGNDPIKLITENPGRFPMWHVKGMDKADPSMNTEIGKGVIDFKPIFAEAKSSGMKHFFVEQETNYQPNPLDSIVSSANFIKKNLL
ncbi:sugar phosphate isomerase/epimerase family protein [Pedobacter sp. MW01-1-1]|uniref:sugar phosphate isomerase/epimerase family protein n=1 Tax=Pedobacter sp. MW01-1-1 TaxID=3383027 RepID=UPI003FEFBD58